MPLNLKKYQYRFNINDLKMFSKIFLNILLMSFSQKFVRAGLWHENSVKRNTSIRDTQYLS